MTGLSGRVSSADVLWALALVVVSLVVTRARRAGLERDIGIATVRAFVQLLAVGFVLDFAFGGHGATSIAVIAVMIATATLTVRSRARAVPSAHVVAAAAVTVATGATLGLLLALRIVPAVPRAVIPLGSMIISSAMNTTSLVMARLGDDLASHRAEVEARLSLALTAHQAAGSWHRRAVQTGMLPIVDQTKVVGLVALPGVMTGMILAGAPPPFAAIRLQLVVMFMLLAGNAFAAVVAGELTVRRLFTVDHQLIRALRRTPSRP